MTVRLERLEEFSLLTLDRPQALNALNADMMDAMGEALKEVQRSDTLGLIITGAGGKTFCAGADVRELAALDLPAQRRSLRHGQQTFALLDALKVPSVAVVDGYAFGGGLELALASSFRLCSHKARLGVPEIRLGLLPGYGATQRLPRLVGQGRALELVMSGRNVEATEALAIGLVHQVFEGDPIAAGVAWLRRFCDYSSPVLALAREAILRSFDDPLDVGLKTESDLAGLALATQDASEGMQAFLDKRSPTFNHR